MVKKKGKLVKKVKKKENACDKEDVIVHISLPPQVEGQLRCYVKVSVNQIVWMVPNSPDETHVRIQWWGEDSTGSIFRPVDVKKVVPNTEQATKTTARYPIRSGPKQFAAYLNDMGTLVMEVLSGAMQVPVGRALVENITQLSPSRPINGFFPVLSADRAKVAELQVSITLESLMASYDSAMSSIPTPDMSVDFYQQRVIANGQPQNLPNTRIVAPVAPTQPIYSANDDPFKSPVSNRVGSRVSDNQMYGGFNPLRESLQSYGSSHRANTDPTTSDRESQPTVRSSTTPPQYPSNSSLQPSTTPQFPSSNSLQPHRYAVQPNNIGQQYSSAGIVTNNPSLESISNYANYLHQQPDLPIPASTFGVTMPFSSKGPPNRNSDSQGTLNGLSTLDSQLGGISNKSSNNHTPRDLSVPTSSSNLPTSDLVSVLLERGNRLKQAMIKSTLPNGGTHTLFEEPAVDLTSYGSIFSPVKQDTSTGDLFKEILSDINPENKTRMASQLLESYDGTLEEKAVDLVMGANMTQQQYKMFKALTGSPTSSVSGDDDIHSELADPLHDDDLLHELFYKQVSDNDSEIDLELYTANSEAGDASYRHRMSRSDLHRANKDANGGNVKKVGSKVFQAGDMGTSAIHRARSGSLASLEDDGNMRTPSRGGSRHSSMSSLLMDTPNTTPKKKKVPTATLR